MLRTSGLGLYYRKESITTISATSCNTYSGVFEINSMLQMLPDLHELDPSLVRNSSSLSSGMDG